MYKGLMALQKPHLPEPRAGVARGVVLMAGGRRITLPALMVGDCSAAMAFPPAAPTAL